MAAEKYGYERERWKDEKGKGENLIKNIEKARGEEGDEARRLWKQIRIQRKKMLNGRRKGWIIG